ncbi:hypothetical protein BGZ70_006977 [Mortierella alpina]|uniref:Uncharacterized protein n=1 Tax=Mortierella alpina TaxID=64518 RepID=A0A9P6JHD4_MORAP|nr:hypothetical protein BGZ70_006977 [Mortierella alpina]
MLLLPPPTKNPPLRATTATEEILALALASISSMNDPERHDNGHDNEHDKDYGYEHEYIEDKIDASNHNNNTVLVYPERRPLLRRKTFWCCCICVLLIVTLVILLPILYFVVLPKIVQSIVNGSRMSLSQLNITEPTDRGMNVTLLGTVDHGGDFPGTIEFPEPIWVSFKDKVLGKMQLQSVDTAGSSDPKDLGNLYTLFSNYLAGRATITTAKGVSVKPNGREPVSWLSDGSWHSISAFPCHREGSQFQRHSPPPVPQVVVASGNSHHIQIDNMVELMIPSSRTVSGESVLLSVYDRTTNQYLGDLSIPQLNIIPGPNPPATQFLFHPTDTALRDQFLSQYLTGTQFPLQVVGTMASTPLPELQKALSLVSLSSSVSGLNPLPKLILSGEAVVTLNTVLSTHQSYASITIQNPLATDLYITGLVAQVQWRTSPFGTLNDSSHLLVPAKGSVTTATTVLQHPEDLGFSVSLTTNFLPANPQVALGEVSRYCLSWKRRSMSTLEQILATPPTLSQASRTRSCGGILS